MLSISYILATDGDGTQLQRALGNAREYLTPQDELLVVGRTSTDSALRLLAANADIVQDVRPQSSGGVAQSLNEGILACRGTYIKLLTEDLQLDRGGVQGVRSQLQTRPVEAILGGGELSDVDGSAEGRRQPIRYYSRPPYPPRSVHSLACFLANLGSGGGLFFRRDCLARVGLLDSRFSSYADEYMARMLALEIDFHYFDRKVFSRFPRQACEGGWQFEQAELLRRHGEWGSLSELFPAGREAVARALGLGGAPESDLLINALYRISRIRATRLKVLLPAVSLGLAGLSKLGNFLDRLLGLPPRFQEQSNAGLVEPMWDDSLTPLRVRARGQFYQQRRGPVY